MKTPAVGDRVIIAPNTHKEFGVMTILDPARKFAPLPLAGAAVIWSSYWQRRLSDGGIRILTEAKPEPAKAEQAHAAEKGKTQ